MSQNSAQLVATRARVGVLQTFDLGNPRSGKHLGDISIARPAPRDPRFFDDGAFRPVWQYGDEVKVHIAAEATVPGSTNADPIAGMDLTVRRYLHDFGFGCILATVGCEHTADTDVLLEIANRMASMDLAALCEGDDILNLEDMRNDVIAQTRSVFDGELVQPRLYTVIHLVELAESVRSAVAHGETIYSRYEREFHALSVRVLRNWRERYPAGASFGEVNASVAPSGVLRFNARNVVFYEFPYSADDVENLYYPALVELRLWDLMVTREISEVKALVRRLEAGSTGRGGIISEVHESRRAALRIAAEFEALSQCTSKRTTRFYEAGMQEFGLNETLRTLRERTSQVEEVLSRQALADEIALERQLVNQQRDLALKAEAAATSAAGVGFVLTGLSLVVGAQLALDVAEAFSWPTRARVAGMCLGVLLPLLLARFAQRRYARRRQLRIAWTEDVCLDCSLADLFETLVAQSHREDVVEIRMDEAGSITLTVNVVQGGWSGQARLEFSDQTSESHDSHWLYIVRVETDVSAPGGSRQAEFVRPSALSILSALRVAVVAHASV